MKKLFLISLAVSSILFAGAQNINKNGGLSKDQIKALQSSYKSTGADKALRNAVVTNDINKLAKNYDNNTAFDAHFSNQVPSKAITDQESSGRCWMFAGMNVLRAKAIKKYDLPSDFQFSQCYTFFWDQLEKSNLFLQAILDNRAKSMEDETVKWLFQNPLSDGGQFTGVSNLVTKYGLVPSDAMPESFCANSTSQMSSQLKNLLREDGLKLRKAWEQKAAAAGKLKGKKAEAATAAAEKELEAMKVDMPKEVYRILVLCLGVPPTEFEWARYDSKGQFVSCRKYTPKSFYQEFVGADLENNYVMLMNDPSREFGKGYEIDYDRHVYDGQNWLYVNLPIERIKEIAIASIKDNTAMYFSCDVGKFLNRQSGVLDMKNFDYESLMGVKFTMDKKERIQTHASGSSHAMTLIAVDIKDGNPVKWMVENSWGAATGYKGNMIMTDEWFNEYMFRLVVEKKYVPQDIMKMLEQKPILLPAWDPMFLGEE